MHAVLALLLTAPWVSASSPDPLPAAVAAAQDALSEADGDDAEFSTDIKPPVCVKADGTQRAPVDHGNALKDRFLEACADSGAQASWCEQALRPNPESRSVFECTYGTEQPFQLIHPDPSTWDNVFKALALVSELSREGIGVCLINNWWRPEPYNANVSGAPGRHPFATAVDVKFCTLDDKEKAFVELCRLRRQGRLRALGYYPGSTVLHLGVGDRAGNTWGKPCPEP